MVQENVLYVYYCHNTPDRLVFSDKVKGPATLIIAIFNKMQSFKLQLPLDKFEWLLHLLWSDLSENCIEQVLAIHSR